MPCKPLYRSTHALYSHNFALEGAIFALEAPYLLFALLLIERVEVDWNEIAAETCQNLIESMPRRIQAVIRANGGHTKY